VLAPIDLDIGVEAPRAVFVRGRGLDAELGGDLHVAGTYAAPQVGGGFDMRRGTLALAGASLKFSSGRVSFNGAGPKRTLDPTLDFVAESVSGDVTATLTVGGYASAPTIELTSSPDLPQDEILSRLLFGVDAKQLAPLQMLGIGVALASISGVGYGGADPLAAIQKRLGLDRLAVGGSTGTDPSAATVEAGRYVSPRVYVGAVQSTTGITRLQAQIDLSKHLKLQTVVGNGSATAQGTTPQNDPGNTVGLVYQIDY
jgi:translocation and assembly module TamB